MKNSGFKMSGYSYPGTSPYQTHGEESNSPLNQGKLGLLKKGIELVTKYGKKVYKAIKGGSATTIPKKTTSYIKHDPKSGHLRFQTDYTRSGGKTTGHYIPVSGSATGKPGGLKIDDARTHRLPKGFGWKDVDKIVKEYTGK